MPISLIVIIFLLIIPLLIISAKPGLAVLKAGLILLEIIPNSQFKPTIYLTKSPIIKEVEYSDGERKFVADLYRPDDKKKHPAMILIYGVLPEGRKDQRLIDLGKTLSRLGYVVFIPDFDNLKKGIPGREDVEQLIFAFNWLEEKNFVEKDKIGMTGFCYGAAVAILAAEDSRISEKINFINSFGGFLDIKNVIRDVLTNTCTYNETKIVSWIPEDYAKNILIDQLIGLLQEEKDREILKKTIKEDKGVLDETSEKKLSPNGLAMYKVLTNKDPRKTKELIKNLDSRIQRIFSEFSPVKDIKNLKTDLFLLHSELDEIVCKSEAYNLKDAVKDGTKVEIIVLRIFRHMTFEIPQANLKTIFSEYLPEILKFYRFLFQVINRV